MAERTQLTFLSSDTDRVPWVQEACRLPALGTARVHPMRIRLRPPMSLSLHTVERPHHLARRHMHHPRSTTEAGEPHHRHTPRRPLLSISHHPAIHRPARGIHLRRLRSHQRHRGTVRSRRPSVPHLRGTRQLAHRLAPHLLDIHLLPPRKCLRRLQNTRPRHQCHPHHPNILQLLQHILQPLLPIPLFRLRTVQHLRNGRLLALPKTVQLTVDTHTVRPHHGSEYVGGIFSARAYCLMLDIPLGYRHYLVRFRRYAPHVDYRTILLCKLDSNNVRVE